MSLVGASRRTAVAVVELALLLAFGAEARAEQGPAAGPRRANGARSVVSKPAPPETKRAAPAKASEPAKAASRPAYQKSRPPKQPSPTLPEGTPRPELDSATRQQIAGGATEDDRENGANDPELRALHDADRVLFPKPLPGARPGWSWDLPRPVQPESETQVVANGLPPVAMPRSDKASELPTEAAWVKSLAMPNLPLRLDGRVIKYLQFYRDSAQGKAIASVWAKKSGRYIPALKAEFAKAGLPTDLVWLSVIESGHNPTIISPAGAAGLWQFGAQTARTYGLVVDRWVDERFEPFRATQAASRYLYDLHQRFGSWELAMAAYNMGHGGIQHAIEKFNTNDFWELSRYEAALPWETALYVPKILAVAIVMNNRAAFGIDGVTPDPPTSFDTVLVEPAVSLEKVAQAAGLSTTEVQALNPQYVSGRTPPMAPGTAKRTWPIQLPLNTGATVSTWLAKHAESKDSAMPYVVRFGDTVESIALSLDSTEERLRSLNRIAPEEALQPGTVLLVPKNQGSLPLAAPSDNVVVVAAHSYEYPDRKRVFYRVLVGDTLNRIAEAFSVSRGELITWNSLDESARLQSGMTLQIFVKQSTNLDRVAHIEEASVRILTAGSPEFCDYFEGLKGRKRMVVKALTGETLNGVARRYGMTGGWIERVNHRSRREKLNAGETVIVYVDRHVPAPGGRPTETARQELRPARPPRPDALPAASSSSLTEAPAPKASEKKD